MQDVVSVATQLIAEVPSYATLEGVAVTFTFGRGIGFGVGVGATAGVGVVTTGTGVDVTGACAWLSVTTDDFAAGAAGTLFGVATRLDGETALLVMVGDVETDDVLEATIGGTETGCTCCVW